MDDEKNGKYDFYKRASKAKGLKNLKLFGVRPKNRVQVTWLGGLTRALCRRLPDDDLVFAHRDQITPIRAPLDLQNSLLVLAQDSHQGVVIHVPNSYSVVVAPTGKSPAIRIPTQRMYLA